MIIKTQEAIPIFVIILSFIFAGYAYPYMPALMATHWGVDNIVNGYASKQLALFLIPITLLVLYPFFLLLPKYAPYKKNFHEFRQYYNIFVTLIFFFLFYLYILILVWNVEIYFNMLQFLAPAFSIILYYAGLLSSKTKMNWFVGIRTPWAYKNELVWQKTQNFGANMFKISAVICLFSLIIPSLSAVFILVPIIFSVIAVNVYSFLEAKTHKKISHQSR